jgi:xeroderma pigmentosum group C-complementing protein
MAVPVISGVVVAEEYHDTIMEEWEKDEAERIRKEDEKRREAVIKMWRKMLMGMRVVKRIREDYGGEDPDAVDAVNPFTRRDVDDDGLNNAHEEMRRREEDMAGGFFHAGHEEEELGHDTSYFPVASQGDGGGGFVVEEHDEFTKHADNSGSAMAQPSVTAAKLEEPTSPVDEDSEPEVSTLQKRRGPSTTAKDPKKPAASRSKPPKARTGTAPTNRRVKAEQDEDDEDEDASDLSSISSDPESEDYVAPAKMRKTPQRKKATPAKAAPTSQTRRTPGRAAKARATDLTSPYFNHKDEDEDES